MRTQLLGQLEIDESRLNTELAQTIDFQYAEPYSEFLCGRPWKSCMLWAASGDVGDNVIAHYDTRKRPGFTKYGQELPYLREVMERSFALEHLLFARLGIMCDSVLVPHRDYLELGDVPADNRAAHRVHVPLATSSDCLFAEENVIYQMRFGEVWFIDVTKVHSSAVLSDLRRIHLILDFTDVTEWSRLFHFPLRDGSGVPEHRVCPRAPLSPDERAQLLSLASVVDLDNLKDIFGIVIKKHYRRDGGEDFVWGVLDQIADQSGTETVRSKIRELRRYYTMERSE